MLPWRLRHAAAARRRAQPSGRRRRTLVCSAGPSSIMAPPTAPNAPGEHAGGEGALRIRSLFGQAMQDSFTTANSVHHCCWVDAVSGPRADDPCRACSAQARPFGPRSPLPLQCGKSSVESQDRTTPKRYRGAPSTDASDDGTLGDSTTYVPHQQKSWHATYVTGE